MSTKHFDYIANKISAAKRNAKSISSNIGHHGMEGEIRELAIKECLEPFLTQSYLCGNGKIIDSYQSISDQIDIVIYHRKLAPPILINKDLGLFPVECVRYAFEIKSTLTAAEIRDANKKFKSIRSLKSFPRSGANSAETHGPLPTTVLLAFESDLVGSELDRYLKHTTDEYPPCKVLCVLGKGYWFHDTTSKRWYGKEITQSDPKHLEFCMFITGLMNTLTSEEMTMRPFTPGAYISIEDIILPPIAISKT